MAASGPGCWQELLNCLSFRGAVNGSEVLHSGYSHLTHDRHFGSRAPFQDESLFSLLRLFAPRLILANAAKG